MAFRAGVGRADITPPLTVPHAGWGAQTHIAAEGVESELWATALVVEDGHERAALVDLDLVLISREENEAIRARVAEVLGITPDRVRISLTHNHAGPTPSSWNWIAEGQAALRGYYALLPELAAGAARAALHSMRPARAAAGSGESRVAVNRRETAPGGRTISGVNPQGTIDPHVFVLRIDGTDGRPLAAVVGYTMHPTTMGPTNRLMSADWPGYLKRTVERNTGAVCLFVQGATGDVGPGPEGYTADPDVIRRLGAMVGFEAARVYTALKVPAVSYRHERIWESGAPLGKWQAVEQDEEIPRVRSFSEELRLPLGTQKTVSQAEADLTAAQDKLNRLRAMGASAAEVEAATFVTKRANMALSRARTFEGMIEIQVELHILQIGPAVLTAIPCEPFSRIGLEIKAASPFVHTWFGGYAGGWYGYIPTPEEYPRLGYEVETSPFAPGAASAVVEGTVLALRSLERRNAGEGGR